MMGYNIKEVKFYTGMTNNPEDGAFYYDINTFECFLALQGKWNKLEPFDKNKFREFQIIEHRKERKEKLEKIQCL